MPKSSADSDRLAASPPKTGLVGLKGVGPRIAQRLETLGIRTPEDLLFHLPHRYEDRTRIAPLSRLHAGQEALICGEVISTQIHHGRRRSLLCALDDGSGLLTMRFFHFSSNQRERLTRGTWVQCYGEVRRGPQGLEMVHPEYKSGPRDSMQHIDGTLTPIYPATEGIGQATIRRLTEQALQKMEREPLLRELLPEQLLRRFALPDLAEALRSVHRPDAADETATLESIIARSRRRLAFEELLAHNLAMRQRKKEIERIPAPPFESRGELADAFLGDLPFQLTSGQQRAVKEIRSDLRRTFPMLRLVQGDVGAGKTVVGALAALAAIEAGYQVALMAPTELLAEQHLQSFTAWFSPLGLHVEWLVGSLPQRARRQAAERIATGVANLAVGTHALFQADVAFRNLGLVIVDEQHRFGVGQRLALRAKGEQEGLSPHQLIMTATPIPRTLAMTAYADLETSVIDTLPAGRQPITTAVVPNDRRPEVIDRIRDACAKGQQAYWVCTLIEDSELLQAEAVTNTFELLEDALPELSLALVHGRMSAVEKDRVMNEFRAGKTHLLVATTVIEVGVDVPNASLMIIENAERLGLAQLHQLRGRIGRGHRKSACLLMYMAPLGPVARARLEVLRDTTDGFLIAERDLELRGPGELLGTRQTGLTQLRVADLLRDRNLLPDVERAADVIEAGHAESARALIDRWVGSAIDYANA